MRPRTPAMCDPGDDGVCFGVGMVGCTEGGAPVVGVAEAMTLRCLPSFAVLILAIGCDTAEDGEPTLPSELNVAECGETSRIIPRAPDGDDLCTDRPDCYQTSGTPDGGCPNTCSCLCHRGGCYQHACTLVGGCTEPPVYR